MERQCWRWREIGCDRAQNYTECTQSRSGTAKLIRERITCVASFSAYYEYYLFSHFFFGRKLEIQSIPKICLDVLKDKRTVPEVVWSDYFCIMVSYINQFYSVWSTICFVAISFYCLHLIISKYQSKYDWFIYLLFIVCVIHQRLVAHTVQVFEPFSPFHSLLSLRWCSLQFI